MGWTTDSNSHLFWLDSLWNVELPPKVMHNILHVGTNVEESVLQATLHQMHS